MFSSRHWNCHSVFVCGQWKIFLWLNSDQTEWTIKKWRRFVWDLMLLYTMKTEEMRNLEKLCRYSWFQISSTMIDPFVNNLRNVDHVFMILKNFHKIHSHLRAFLKFSKLSTFKNLIPNFQVSKIWYRIFKSQEFGTEFSDLKIWYQIFKSQKVIGTKFSNIRKLVPN